MEIKTPKDQPMVDPTANVLSLVEAAVKRLDDLRDAESRRVNELMELRADYTAQLAEAEAKRIDAIRAVDVSAIGVASERAAAQAQVLATQVTQSAEALRSLVATTATSVAQSLLNVQTQLTDRLALLEKSQYEQKGSSGGMRDMYGWIFAGVMAIVTIGAIIYSFKIPGG